MSVCIHTSLCIFSEQKYFRASSFFPLASWLQESASKNVTCQARRIDRCSHSASFQSSFHSEVADGTGDTGGREQLSSECKEGRARGCKLSMQTRKSVIRCPELQACGGSGEAGMHQHRSGVEGVPFLEESGRAAPRAIEQGPLEAAGGTGCSVESCSACRAPGCVCPKNK